MNTHQHVDSGSIYICPMHPEVTGTKGDKCPKCHMDLELVQKDDTAQFHVRIASEPQAVEAGKPAILSFYINRNGENVSLDVAHEMKMHLLLVNEELTWFDHIHPEEKTDDTYTVTETFPAGGKYLLFTDYKPTGAPQKLHKQKLDIKGVPLPNTIDAATKFVSIVDGYTVTLQNGNDFKTNKTQSLQFSVEKDGMKLQQKDIQNYLGATAHIVMISKADKDFLHIHPVSDSRFPIYAETHIEKPGTYRIWVQFQIDGKVHTADFTVNVSEGEKPAAGHGHHAHHH